ncbi:MAG: hypothetical protein HeimC3_24760 [Candidatus Heimdallarchaeota archaeon LC_3]|nr:MAG: hypothetical protein HeimC3_24760 [Candidatus Heimdallarchaeota archaeon LC_3]
MKTASIRLNSQQEKDIENFAKNENIDKSTAVRKLLDIGLKEIRKKKAIDMVRNRRWTVWKAASHCSESFRSFLSILKENNIPFPITLDELKNEFE